MRTKNPYRQARLKKAWVAGRRAGREEQDLLDRDRALYVAFRRGFNSVAEERRAEAQAALDAQREHAA